MPESVFPTLPGLAWSVGKMPIFSTRIQTSVSGRELRQADQLYPIWEWTLVYDFLRDKYDTREGAGPGHSLDELRTLAGFFLARRGSFEPFLFSDPSDNAITDQYIGTGDGVNTVFQLYRTMGAFFEPITAPLGATIKDDGATVLPADYVINTDTGVVTFDVAPVTAHVITADITYYHRVRFSSDVAEFENFMYQLWSAREIRFRSVLL